jgi:hypothetical protein
MGPPTLEAPLQRIRLTPHLLGPVYSFATLKGIHKKYCIFHDVDA